MEDIKLYLCSCGCRYFTEEERDECEKRHFKDCSKKTFTRVR